MRMKLSFVVITFLMATTLCIIGTGSASKSKASGAGGNELDQMIFNAHSHNTTAKMFSINLIAISQQEAGRCLFPGRLL